MYHFLNDIYNKKISLNHVHSFSATIFILVTSALASIRIMRQLSAVHVVVFNTARSMIVWAFSLAVSWQTFQGLQIGGFLFIILGVMVFNDILIGM